MKTFLLTSVSVLAVLLGLAEAVPEIEGRGDWGTDANGLSCRFTPDNSEYAIGEIVYVLVEITNSTDKPIALGLEPLIEIKHSNGSSLIDKKSLFRRRGHPPACLCVSARRQAGTGLK